MLASRSAVLRKPLRTVAELLAALPATQAAELLDCTPETPIGRPTDDSRAIVAGGCFIAVVGSTHDGHRFLGPALEARPGLLIVQRDRLANSLVSLEGQARVVVEDTRALIPILAAGWYGWPGERLRLAGVTGTNGKTTVAHLVAAVLRAAGRPHLRLGTTGNWLVDHELDAGFTTAFPLELQALLADASERGATDGVMEVSSHALAQGRVEPLRFRAVALTSFSQDHLDFHPDMQAYLQAKCRLALEHCDRGGLAITPREQGEAGSTFLVAADEAGVARCWRSSRTPVPVPEAEIAVLERRPGPGLNARVRTPVGELELRSVMVGDFNLDNLLVTIGLCIGLDLELPQIAAALAQTPGAPGRLERVRVEGSEGPTVYVDYAHTPDAVARALEALRPSVPPGATLSVVLGCGGDRDASKRPLMGEVASRGAERFYATSDNPRSEDPAAIVDQMIAGTVPSPTGATLIREVDRGAAIARAIAEASTQDIVLIAGKGHEDYQILATGKIHFDDREHALQALRRRASPSPSSQP